ncbi:hypothetical protein [Nonomuraea harbinensis]|uniref:TrkH family potassium uptake protein n=1 Tax=Nonomuraea harbinensis TaxID=1286938 RepID=A0ABW1BRF3_9ACTN|nr:hypothetical protein [Nonomuraea harbinensis]
MTRVTVGLSVVLLGGGTLTFLASEWHNPATMGPLDDSGKLLAAFFAAVMPRSGGFNSMDIGQMNPSSWLLTDVLMFIGRIGPLTLGSALALKQRTRRYELPEEKVIVG